MAKIKYDFNDGTSNEVEVSEELYQQILEIEQKEKKSNRRETRRHSSFEFLSENGKEFAIDEADPCIEYLKKEKRQKYLQKLEKLNSISHLLLPEQYQLLREVFIKKRTITEIAKEKKVSRQAIQNRLKKIYEKIKKSLI